MSAADASTSPFLELEALAAPVPDLASTLTTSQAEQDANDANVSFLRTPLVEDDIPPDRTSRQLPSLSQLYYQQQRNRPSDGDDLEHQGRNPGTVASSRRRYSPSELRQLHERASIAAQRPSSTYQGWAPPLQSGRSESDAWSGLPTMSASSAEFYNEQRRALLSTARQIQATTRESSSSGARGTASSPTLANSEHSLRTAALLQSVRRNSQFPARSRSLLQNHSRETEGLGHEGSSRDPQSMSEARRRAALASTRGGRQQEDSPLMTVTTLHDLARRDMLASRYQGLLEDDSRRWQGASKWHLDDAIRYLERLRFCDSYQESVSSAAARGFVKEEFFTDSHDDFILDTTMIDPPAESSWLKIGGIFSGLQHAYRPRGSSASARNRPGNRGSRTYNIPQLGQAQALPTNRHSFSYATRVNLGSRTSGTRTRIRAPTNTIENANYLATDFRTLPLNVAAERSMTPSLSGEKERWPVKVKIHSVDYDSMTLTGSMEAYDVPDKDGAVKTPMIMTYLEGEIIDFNKYTLETKHYDTDETTDSLYWRMLEPFSKLTDDEMVQGLLSKKWMKDELRQKYILMRWKEKCFVSPEEASAVLSISGFYYISMRRSDGHIEGLYYDPLSNPFQHLALAPEGRRQFPTYEFT
ncbi:MAG: hypothetical protein LQ352_007661 [Teloschistes flavicans]|nr:MAG: hypothetical protein LQ352_007661 [Teloschistes flavicans]